MLTAIVGINWGDEGKGRMVDLLSEDYDIVVRYQGGNNAGHTVINEKGTFILNLLPSGILRENTINVLGPGMAIDLEHLTLEIAALQQKGISITPKNLKISDKAIIALPYHKKLDILEEERLGASAYGSTRRGIAPVYSDKYMKKAIRMGDIISDSNWLKEKIEFIAKYKNLALQKGYGQDPINPRDIMFWLSKYGEFLKEYITDTSIFLDNSKIQSKKIMFEAQLGALRDIDYGIYPFTSSSSTIAAYAPIGSGIPHLSLDEVNGIVKAYSTCVGAGPFVCEMEGEEAEKLRAAGNEYGATTGRPRRVGPLDIVASKYGAKVQGATYLTLTKLDVLSYMEKIPVCIGYEIDGETTENFQIGYKLETAKPIIQYLDGFNCDISKARKKEDLPKEAINYIKYIEEKIGVPIKYVSVGPKRDEYLEF